MTERTAGDILGGVFVYFVRSVYILWCIFVEFPILNLYPPGYIIKTQRTTPHPIPPHTPKGEPQ